MWDHIIKNGTVVTGNDCFQADLYITGGKIVAVTKAELPEEGREVTDATGKYIFPGFIDPHVHSREGRFGARHKEDFSYSSASAICSGFTTIFEMPNCNPATWNVDEVHALEEEITPKAFSDFGLWGMCLGDINNRYIGAMSEAGVIGFKFFWGYAIDPRGYQLIYNYDKSMEHVVPPLDTGDIYKIFRAVAETGNVLAIHAENIDIIKALTEEARDGSLSPYDELLASRPVVSELSTISEAVLLAREFGTKLHILHVPSAGSADLIRMARREGVDITAETCPHYLALTNEDAERIGPRMKTHPLVRTKRDQEILWERIKDGTISFVASDHATHTFKDKAKPFWDALPGIAGLETMSMIMLDSVNKGMISLNDITRLLSENAARRYGLFPNKGSLEVGTDADIAIVDMDQEYVFKAEDMHSKIKMSPYDGMHFKGRVVKTFLRGKVVYDNGEIIGEPMGRMVRPKL